MPNFTYKSVTKNGEIKTGVFTAYSTDEVLVMLKNNNQYPIKIEKEVVRIGNITFAKKVTFKDLSIFSKQFHTMLHAGVTIVKIVDVLRSQSTHPTLRLALERVYIDIQTGSLLSVAFSEFPTIFPEFMVNMLEAGEASGNLELVMERLATHYEKENAIIGKLKSALIYPIVLLTITFVMIIAMLVFVLPMFEGMFKDSGQTLPGLTQGLINASAFLIADWPYVLVVIALFAMAIMYALRLNVVKLGIDKLKFKIPVYGDLTQKTASSRFARTLSTLLFSGLPLLSALEITSKVIGNRNVELLLTKSLDDIKRGMELSTVIRKTKVFPPMLDFMVSIGEESGAMDDVLTKIADIYDDEIDVAVKNLTALMEPALIVIMAGLVGTMVIAIALPMFNMASTIQ